MTPLRFLCRETDTAPSDWEDIDGPQTRFGIDSWFTGHLQPVTLTAAYLADALEIAPKLCLIDEMTAVVTRRDDGALCVVMPMRIGTADRSAA